MAARAAVGWDRRPRDDVHLTPVSFALISNNKASAAVALTATTSAANITGATLLIAVVCMYSKSAATATVSSTSNASGAWTAIANYVNGTSNICIWYCANPATSASETFSCNPNGTGYPTIFASWWSGAATSSPKDQHNGAASASGTTLATGSITPGQANELIITGISDNDAGNKTVDSSVTRQDTQLSNIYETGAWGYLIQTTATAINPTWTEANTVARAVAIASFKAAASFQSAWAITSGLSGSGIYVS